MTTRPPTAERFLVSKIAALGKGSFNNGEQDWLSIVVTTEGGMIWTNTYMLKAAKIIEEAIRLKHTWVTL